MLRITQVRLSVDPYPLRAVELQQPSCPVDHSRYLWPLSAARIDERTAVAVRCLFASSVAHYSFGIRSLGRHSR